jgi:hypothetical protein
MASAPFSESVLRNLHMHIFCAECLKINHSGVGISRKIVFFVMVRASFQIFCPDFRRSNGPIGIAVPKFTAVSAMQGAEFRREFPTCAVHGGKSLSLSPNKHLPASRLPELACGMHLWLSEGLVAAAAIGLLDCSPLMRELP